MIGEVPSQGRADGRAELGIKHDQQRLVHPITTEPLVEGEFGDVRALPGEHNLGGSAVHRQDGLSQLAAGLNRLPHLRIGVVEGAEGGTKRGDVVIGVQHLRCAPHTRVVPNLKLATPFGWAQEAS